MTFIGGFADVASLHRMREGRRERGNGMTEHSCTVRGDDGARREGRKRLVTEGRADKWSGGWLVVFVVCMVNKWLRLGIIPLLLAPSPE